MPRRPGVPAEFGPPPELPDLHRAGDHAASVVSAQVRAGRWSRVRRGVYADTVPAENAYAAARRASLEHIAAVRACLGGDAVLSRESAALLWGLPLDRRPAAVHVVQPTTPRAGLPRDVGRHVVDLPPAHVTLRAGIRVTTPERTAVDCAATLPAAAGLAVVDAALHRGADREVLEELVAGRPGARGIRRARAVVAVADDGAESPGESLARLTIVRLGVRPPVTQVAVQTDLGTFWADLGWPQWRVVAEYDGAAKYAARGDAVDAVLREKRRQEAMEEAGWSVLRLISDDLRAPERLLRRLRRALPPDAFGLPVDRHLR